MEPPRKEKNKLTNCHKKHSWSKHFSIPYELWMYTFTDSSCGIKSRQINISLSKSRKERADILRSYRHGW